MAAQDGASNASDSPRRGGGLLVAIGGLLLAAGSFWPELLVIGGNALHAAGAPRPLPGRSHYAVFAENWDVLLHPDPYVPTPFSSTLDYALQAAALAWLALAGALLFATAPFARSRLVARLALLFHGGALLTLGGGALALRFSLPADDAGGAKESRLILIGGAVLLVLALIEWLVGRGALRSDRPAAASATRLAPTDRAQLMPIAFLLLLNGGLFAALCRHPNWPSAGYLVGAIGAAIALLGMRRRRAG